MSRRSSPTRSRTALAWGLGAFVSLQVGLAVGIELALPQLRDPLYGDKLHQLRRRTAAAKESEVLVVLGSSRTAHALDAATAELQLKTRVARPSLVYNFGVPGAGPVTNLVNLKRLLAGGVRPDLVVIEVLPPLLAVQAPAVELFQFPAERIWWSEIPLIEHYASIAPDVDHLRRDWWLGGCVPWHAHRFGILRVLLPDFVPRLGREAWFARFDEHGWTGIHKDFRTADRYRDGLARARADYEAYLTDFRLGGTGCEALRETLATCREQRIRAALLLSPEAPEFQAFYSADAWLQIKSYLEQLLREFDVALVDARDWMAGDDFLDSHHLLVPGAVRFSERFGRRTAALLREPAWTAGARRDTRK
ncbi:MAG TPA: DUF1574 family protein [Pirellulales bacterium]|nr:DUF1574 family protein [Pirellulales bacterium]